MTNIAGLHPTPMDTCGRRRSHRKPDGSSPARFVAPCMAMNQADLIKALRAYDAPSGRTVRPACSCSARALGTERPDRDFDLFIDYDPEAKIPNLFRLMQIEDEISKALGIAVTITTRDALHPSMREASSKTPCGSRNAEGPDDCNWRLPRRDRNPARDRSKHEPLGVPDRSDCSLRGGLRYSDHIGGCAAHSRRVARGLSNRDLGSNQSHRQSPPS
jgi:hypothetical protein